MKRSYFYVLPVLLMILVFGSPVFAAEIGEEPFPLKVFLKYNTTQGSDPFLMAEISAELFQLDNEKNEKIMAEEIYAWTDAENETDKTAIEDSERQFAAIMHIQLSRLLVGVTAILQFKFFHANLLY